VRRVPGSRPWRAAAIRLLAVAIIALLVGAAWQAVGRYSKPPDRKGSPASQTTVALGDVLTRTTVVGSPIKRASPDAVMVGQSAGVRLLSYGFVPSYGQGAALRAAPAGRRLIAFTAVPTAGEDGQAQPMLSLRVGTTERGPLVVTKDYVVASVASGESNVALVLTNGDVKQSISLITGLPSRSNLDVCTRAHRGATVNAARKVTVKVTDKSGRSGMTSGTLTVRAVSLTYWGADGSRPSSTGRALLHIEATVKLAGDREGYGAEPGLLSVTAPGATAGPARNAAADSHAEVDAVTDVPADITTGTIHYAGTIRTATGTIGVVTPISVPFSIPAG
jgi:hypothetical protein